MKFAIITHVVHHKKENLLYAYSPYVKEMNLWGKYVDEILLVAPLTNKNITSIQTPYKNEKLEIFEVSSISLKSVTEILKAIFLLPLIVFTVFKAMKKADHIHLRCPGNIGLVGCLVQTLFPSKPKTAKYAGNWDPDSKQPRSYRFQKWILSNTFLTKNMQVLVYGNWSKQSKNILPFFTASYSKEKKEQIRTRDYTSTLRFVFVGTLSNGKQPLYAVQFVEQLIKNKIDCRLDFYGEGKERLIIEKYITNNQLSKVIKLHGNQAAAIVEGAYKESDFLILPSKSEGWPKVVAEAMFWGVIPIVTKISCVPWMLDFGSRGLFIENEIETDTGKLIGLLTDTDELQQMAIASQKWAQEYTLERFEMEIKKLLL
ncbi:MAG: glycosyltransferase [Flavobacteriaceae bacterium]